MSAPVSNPRSSPHLPARRRFLAWLAAAGAASVVGATGWAAAAPPEKCFRIVQRRGRWWLEQPDGGRFFSTGLNHIDATPLRDPAAGGRWSAKYGNSMQRWLTEAVGPDLRAWGFNTVGWTQEVVLRGEQTHRHSPAFTFEEYQWLGLPYCHLLPFSEIHVWDDETRHPDFFSRDFADWCDYVARSQCARFAEDPKLIGYFYSDCPMWVNTRPTNEWKGPLFDPEKLKTDAGRAELRRLATRYYQVTHDAIRRYDPHHLILGDRYNADAPLPIEVLESAAPFVDVFSFQAFKEPVRHLAEWHARTGKPVLWADGAHGMRAKDAVSGEEIMRNNGRWYAEVLKGLRENPGCVGAHLCGAYLRNRARRRGLRDPLEQPDAENLALITQANRETAEWVEKS